MIKCFKCELVDHVQKAGIIRGKQRYLCKSCNFHFTISEPNSKLKNPPHQVTIMDLANELGISKSTVSRALRGHSDIHSETRKMVLELAQKLEYEPNPLASGLLKSRTNTIGIIVPEFRHYFYPAFIIGVQSVLSKAGYNVMICQSDECYETEVANVKALMSSRVDGFLVSVSSQTNNFDHFRTTIRKGIPLVFFNRVCPELDTPQVVVDDYHGAFVAVEHLIEQGYKSIAHLGGPSSLQLSKNRKQGYLDALEKHKLKIDPKLIIEFDLTDEKARIYATHLLNLPNPPDAIFAINDPTAIKIMILAKNKGIKIPEELGVVGFSNDPISLIVEPQLTTISQPIEEMGKLSASILIKALQEKVITNDRHQLLTKLIVRGSSVRR